MGRLLSFLCSLLVILAIFESCYRRTSNLITLESAISGADCHRGNEIIVLTQSSVKDLCRSKGYSQLLSRAKKDNYRCLISDISSLKYYFSKGILGITSTPWVLSLSNGYLVESESLTDYIDNKKYLIENSKLVTDKLRLYFSLYANNTPDIDSCGIEALLHEDRDSFSSNYLNYLANKSDSLKDTLLQESVLNAYNEVEDSLLNVIYVKLLRENRTLKGLEDPLVFPVRVFDLGEVYNGTLVELLVPFYNISRESAYIYNISVSCNCLSVECEDRIIRDNDKHVLKVSYDVGNTKELIKKSIVVISDNKKPEIIEILAKVI